MVADEDDSYIVREPWLLRKSHFLVNNADNHIHTLSKVGFLSETNLSTGRRYTLYKECFWCKSATGMNWLPVYLFPNEQHARAFLSKTRDQFTSFDAQLDASGPLGSDEPYRVLKVDRQATREQIRKAFREQARSLHPDAGGDPDTFKVLVQAYNTLMGR